MSANDPINATMQVYIDQFKKATGPIQRAEVIEEMYKYFITPDVIKWMDNDNPKFLTVAVKNVPKFRAELQYLNTPLPLSQMRALDAAFDAFLSRRIRRQSERLRIRRMSA